MAEVAFDNYWALPPIARTTATAAFVLSIGIHLTGLLPGHSFVWVRELFFAFPPHIWRYPTSFLITGPNLSILFDTFFLYSNLKQIEVGHPRFSRREDVIWLMLVLSALILTLTELTGFRMGTYLSPFTVGLCYLVTQEQQGMKTNYMFFNVPSPMLPYFMLMINLFFPGGIHMLLFQFHGLVAAHAIFFFSRVWPQCGGGRNWLATPAFMSKVVETPRVFQRAYGTASRPTTGQSSGSSTGASSGPLPDSWRTRGSGQRLG